MMKTKLFIALIVLASNVYAQDSTLAVATPATITLLPITLFGDLRHRYEHVTAETTTVNDNEEYEQTRLRARLGVRGEPTDDVSVELRLATAEGGTSTNQSYGEDSATVTSDAKGMRNYGIKLDRAYFKWVLGGDITLTGGRMANPFVAPGGNDMLWDLDLNFDGTALSWGRKFNGTDIFVTVGDFTLEETKANAGTDVSLQSAQIGGRTKFADKYSAALIVSYHSFSGVKGQDSLAAGTFNGNSNTGGLYVHNYAVFATGVEFGFEAGGCPVTVFYEMGKNPHLDNENNASIAGLKINKAKNKGDWLLVIDHREVERDATIGAFTDSDTFGGGTNGKNLRVAGHYMVSDAVEVVLASHAGEIDIASGQTAVDRERIQADINIKF